MIYNSTFKEVNKEWNNIIAKRSTNRRVQIYSRMIAPIIASYIYKHPLFDDLITTKIENRIAIAISNTSIKDGYMSGY